MASTFTYHFQPQPPPMPPVTGAKRGPSGPLTVPSSSEDEDSDTSESLPPPLPQHQLTVIHASEMPLSPRYKQVFSLSSPRSKTTGGKFAPTYSRKDASGGEVGDHPESDTEESPSLPSQPETNHPPRTNFAHEHDHDYENVASPCSSTASGPIYVRPPGFTHHAQEVECVKSKVVARRKSQAAAAVLCLRDRSFKKREQTPPKPKAKRDPLPMKQRALPQSFFQQPNLTQQVSPATMFPVLPPLCNRDTEEDMTEVRPVTPPHDSPENEKGRQPERQGERKITMANTDLLFKLFENVPEEKKVTGGHLKGRGRPKRPVGKSCMKGLLSANDPYLAEKFFPQLSNERSRFNSLQLVTLGSGDKSVTLPSLAVEQNYTHMLSELVANM